MLDRPASQSARRRIEQARTPAQFDAARELIREYAAALEVALEPVELAEELATMPVWYGPPRGCVLLALEDDRPIGCVALRALDAEVGEIKRLYVRPGRRGGGVGRQLVETLLERARACGYRKMRLDTLSSMKAARAIYQSLGFRPIAPYCQACSPDSLFYELNLARRAKPVADRLV